MSFSRTKRSLAVLTAAGLALIAYGALAEGLRRGYAVANTDMGMATPGSGSTSDASNFVCG